MSRTLLSLVFLALLPALCRAALDPETDTPYQLQVVVRVAEHPLLTPVFKDQVQRGLKETLQAALGPMGKVEVVDSHPLLAQVEAKGLLRGLDDPAWQKLSNVKTHFVFIDYVDGQYEIQARQHDGLTGLVSPVVRRVQLSDPAERPLVARTAALLVDRDFGLVGTVLDKPQNDVVQLAIKGGKLGAPLDRWVQKGEVFAIAQINAGGTGDRGQWSARVEGALLQVLDNPMDGVCKCRLVHRYENASLAAGLGYRCLKLGTTKAPLRIRLVDRDTQRPVAASLQVTVSPTNFDAATGVDQFSIQDVLQTAKPYEHVAFVRVLNSGNALVAQIPVEIFDEGLMTFSIHVDRQKSEQGEFYLRRGRWLKQLYDRLRVMGEFRKDLNRLLEQKKHEEALKKAQEGAQGLEEDINAFQAEKIRLQDEAKKVKVEDRLLAEGAERIKELRAKGEELKAAIENLNEVLTQEPKVQKAIGLIGEARAHKDAAEFDQALSKYKLALDEGVTIKGLQEEYKELQKAWELKGPDHAKARDFIYKVWAALDNTDKIGERKEEAKAAFQVCKSKGDKLSLLMLFKTTVDHISKLTAELETLQQQASEDNKKRADAIAKIVDDLKKLLQDMTAFLEAGKKK